MANNILIFSDLHLHSHKKSNDRLQDCIDVLIWVFNTAIEKNIQSVVFPGDLFHDRTKIEILTLFRVFEIFEKYFTPKKPFDLYLLLGNHDMWNRDKHDVHSPAFLRAFDGVNVIDKMCSLEIQGHFIDFLPFTENPISDLATLQTLVPRNGDKRLLCSHLAIHGAKLNSFTEADVVVEHDGEMVAVNQEFLKDWDKVFLGHYHGAQILENGIEYVGSPLELTKSEAFQEKHIIIFDLDTFEKEYIVNDFSPRHLVLKPEQLYKHDLSKHFVTVVVPDIASQSEIVEMRHEILKNHTVGSLEIKPNRKKNNNQDQQSVKDARAILETQDKMLERYLAECSDEEKKGLDIELLLKMGMIVIGTDPNNEESINAAKVALMPGNLQVDKDFLIKDALDNLHPIMRKFIERNNNEKD